MSPTLLDPLPEFQRADELGALVVELAMLLVGGLLRFERTVAHILAGERGCDHEHFSE